MAFLRFLDALIHFLALSLISTVRIFQGKNTHRRGEPLLERGEHPEELARFAP